MDNEILIPKLGWSIDEATFVEWLKSNGEYINTGDFQITTPRLFEKTGRSPSRAARRRSRRACRSSQSGTPLPPAQ